jgi:hypothetical protein
LLLLVVEVQLPGTVVVAVAAVFLQVLDFQLHKAHHIQ